ncbi:asialoglycoprotein receptor 2-like [Patiria miniata]|uniref:C-type lectin domain-containing protein n=1 Tax=Patiria miniata TaxID=46514 RepID=A0A914A4K8_PATMI|nr:asialoglycoprotein receptor 2-like [Patiria miniata]
MREMMVRKRFICCLISLHLMMGCTGGNEMCKTSSSGRRWACPPPWIQWGGKCYRAIMNPLTWAEAKDECIKMGGVLAVPQSQEETDFLMRLVPTRFWINCNNFEEEGIWKCLDLTDEVEFMNWAAKQPDNHGGNEDCVELFRSGKWNDLPCHIWKCQDGTDEVEFRNRVTDGNQLQPDNSGGLRCGTAK